MEELPIEKHVDKEVFEAIGLAIVTWAVLEQHMSVALWWLANPDPTLKKKRSLLPIVLSSGMSAKTMFGKLRYLVRLHFPDQMIDFNKLINKIDRANDNKRIPLAHHMLGTQPNKKSIRLGTLKTTGKKTFEERQVTANEIRKWAIEFHELGSKLTAFLAPHGFETALKNFEKAKY